MQILEIHINRKPVTAISDDVGLVVSENRLDDHGPSTMAEVATFVRNLVGCVVDRDDYTQEKVVRIKSYRVFDGWLLAIAAETEPV